MAENVLGALADLQEESKPEPKEETNEAVSSVIKVETPNATSVLFCGSADFAAAAKGASGKAQQKKDGANGEEFRAPVIIASLNDKKVRYLSVGPSAGHIVALTGEGTYAWGLNGNGQLGLGAKGGYVHPGPVRAKLWDVDGDTPIAVAAGNRHTLVLYASGTILSCGAGERAQLGLGHKGAALNDQNKPQKVPIEAKVACIAAGHDYSLCADEGGALYSWGWSEYGKLGTGTDGSYNTRDSSIKITYTATDISKIPMEGKIIQVSAGKHHAACLTDEGLGYTWGDNGYGKLGHRDQKQRNAPTRVQGARFSTLLCGDVSTAGLGWPEYQGRPFSKQSGDGLVWVWGVLKGSNGEGATHPVPNYDVQGWAIDKSNFALGGTHCALSGEGAGVAWAFSPVAFGQLGFGPNGVKSSHTANKMDVREGLVARQVVASVGQTHLLVDTDTVKGVETWEPPTEPLPAPPSKPRGPPPKKKARK